MTDRIIQGPYEFGITPPSHLCGWIPDLSEREFHKAEVAKDGPFLHYEDYRKEAELLIPVKDRTEPEGTKIWEYAKQLLGGKHIPTWRQLIGDCTGWGGRNTVAYLLVHLIARRYREMVLRYPFVPHLYGISRCHPDLGNGQLGSEDGSTGAWMAGALRMGCLWDADDNPNMPTYSAAVAKQWGRRPGPPEWARELAKDNPMGKTAKLTTIEQVRHELINRRPVTMACMYDFEMQPREYMGYHVFRRGRVGGGHQVALIEWMDKPFGAAAEIGSWGERAHGTPIAPEGDTPGPPGGAWMRDEDIDYHLRNGYSEFFAMSLQAGHPSPPDLGPL